WAGPSHHIRAPTHASDDARAAAKTTAERGSKRIMRTTMPPLSSQAVKRRGERKVDAGPPVSSGSLAQQLGIDPSLAAVQFGHDGGAGLIRHPAPGGDLGQGS